MGTMATRKIHVTEGVGFVGSNLCGALRGDGHNVIVYDSRFRFIGSVVRDTDAVNDAAHDIAAILSHQSQEALRCASW